MYGSDRTVNRFGTMQKIRGVARGGPRGTVPPFSGAFFFSKKAFLNKRAQVLRESA